MKRIFIAALILCMFSAEAFAAVSVDPSRIAAGARALAMGRVSAAFPGDINALFINPANAAAFKNWGATSMYTQLLEGDINYTLLGGAKESFGGTVGLSYLAGASSGIAATTVDAVTGRVVTTGSTFDYSNSTISLVYGKEFSPSLAAGGSLKLVSKNFSGQASGNGYGMDLGLLFKPRPGLDLGLTVQNLASAINWSTGTGDNLPFGIKGGLAFKPRENLELAADIDLSPMSLHAGAEYRFNPLFCLRGGLESVPTGTSSSILNLTTGLGLSFKDVNFDYAYFIDGSLAANSTHYFSLSFVHGVPTKEAVPVKVEKPLEKKEEPKKIPVKKTGKPLKR